MNSKKLYFVLISIIVLTVIGTSILVYFSNKSLSNESVKLDTARSMSQRNTMLDTKFKEISSNSRYWKEPSRNLYETVKSMLPSQKDQVEAVSLIQYLAQQNGDGLTINSITFPTSELGAKPAPTPSPSSDSATPTTTSTATTVKVTQTKTLKDIPGILAIETKISLKPPTGSTSIDYISFLRFLDGLTNNSRLMQVTELSVSPDLKGADIIVNILIKQ